MNKRNVKQVEGRALLRKLEVGDVPEPHVHVQALCQHGHLNPFKEILANSTTSGRG